MLGRIEGEVVGPRVLTDVAFAGLEFAGPFPTPDEALEHLLEGPSGEGAAA
jgi:hypothetical protein